MHDISYDPLLNTDWPFEKVGEDYFKNKITEKEEVCFVAEIDGTIVGYLAGGIVQAYAYRKIAKQSELENTLVKDAYRGEGIGEELCKAFFTWSKEQGAARIKVSASAQDTGAIAFYEKVGFIPYAAELEYEIK